jgi:hypothetical protein
MVSATHKQNYLDGRGHQTIVSPLAADGQTGFKKTRTQWVVIGSATIPRISRDLQDNNTSGSKAF